MSPDAPDYLTLFANYKDAAGPRDMGKAYLEDNHEGYRLLFEQVCRLLVKSSPFNQAMPHAFDADGRQ